MGWLSKGNPDPEYCAQVIEAATANRKGSSNGGSTQSVIDRHNASRQPENRAARGNQQQV